MFQESCRRLLDIHSACIRIQPLILNRSRVEFIKDKAAVREVARELKAIRKAAKGISYSSRESCPEIHWERLSAVQIVFFHEYYGIDVDAIWVIFQKTISALAEELETVLKIQTLKSIIQNG